MKTSPFTQGFSLLEVLVALAVFGFAAVSLIDELNASLNLVARQTTRLQDALVIQRGFGLLDVARWKKAKDDKNQGGRTYMPTGQGPASFLPFPWVDAELEQTTPRAQSEEMLLKIEDFPVMIGITTRLEKRTDTGALQTLAERLVLQEDPKIMEGFKKMFQSGKKDKDSEEKTKEHADSKKEPTPPATQPKESP